MDSALLNPSAYLRSQEFERKDVTFTIASVTLGELPTEGAKVNGKQPVKRKGLIGFKETPKLWVMNRTNADSLKAMWGSETNNWIGKRVTLYPAPFTNHQTGEVTTAIRVRGSPDIAADMVAMVKLPFRSVLELKMLKTGVDGKKTAHPPSAVDQPIVPKFSRYAGQNIDAADMLVLREIEAEATEMLAKYPSGEAAKKIAAWLNAVLEPAKARLLASQEPGSEG